MADEPDITASPAGNIETVSEYVRRLPPGKLTKEQIDQQLQDERESWEDR